MNSLLTIPIMDTLNRLIKENEPNLSEWGKLSQTIPLKYIQNNIHLPWNWCLISYRDDLTYEFVKNNKTKL